MSQKRESPFADEWRRCLREHYQYVARTNDQKTRETLEPILTKIGFRDDELRQLYVEATMRADDMPDDFVPDVTLTDDDDVVPEPQAAAEEPQPEATFITHPAECQCAACMDVVLDEGHDEDGQPLPLEETDDSDPPPKQKSLF